MKRLSILVLSLFFLWGCGKSDSLPTTVETIRTEQTEAPETGPEGILDPEDMTQPVQTRSVAKPVRISVQDEQKNEILYREYAYDDYGRQKEYWEYDGEGNLTTFSETEYDSGLEYTITFHSGETTYSVFYRCDETGKILHQEMIQEGQIVNATDYTYDDRGNQLTLTMTNGEEENTISYEYDYNEDGNATQVREYQGENLIGWTEYDYDDWNRQIASRYYAADGTLSHTTETVWDGNSSTVTSFDGEGNAYLIQITEMDDHGLVLWKETWQDGIIVSRMEYTYEQLEIIVQ